MSISSSLAHKYDEFEEFPQPSAPKSAYEELKEWCEKHLSENAYKIVPESTTFAQAIYFTENSVGFVCFNDDGSVCGCGGCDEEGMREHLFDLAIDEELRS